LITDGHDGPAAGNALGDPLGGFSAGRHGFLDEKRDAVVNEPIFYRAVPMGRHADEDNVGPTLSHEGVERREAHTAVAAGGSIGFILRCGEVSDNLSLSERRECRKMAGRDGSRANYADAHHHRRGAV
jgi:hypothetical protein